MTYCVCVTRFVVFSYYYYYQQLYDYYYYDYFFPLPFFLSSFYQVFVVFWFSLFTFLNVICQHLLTFELLCFKLNTLSSRKGEAKVEEELHIADCRCTTLQLFSPKNRSYLGYDSMHR